MQCTHLRIYCHGCIVEITKDVVGITIFFVVPIQLLDREKYRPLFYHNTYITSCGKVKKSSQYSFVLHPVYHRLFIVTNTLSVDALLE